MKLKVINMVTRVRHAAIFWTSCERQETLHDESDEPVEQAHYRTKVSEEMHGYQISDRKIMTPNAGVRKQRMMEHLNSYDLR